MAPDVVGPEIHVPVREAVYGDPAPVVGQRWTLGGCVVVDHLLQFPAGAIDPGELTLTGVSRTRPVANWPGRGCRQPDVPADLFLHDERISLEFLPVRIEPLRKDLSIAGEQQMPGPGVDCGANIEQA